TSILFPYTTLFRSHAVIGVTQCSARRIPDRMVRQVEDLGSKFYILRLADRELLIDRGIEVYNARTSHGVPRGVSIAVLRSERKPVHERVGVEKVSSDPLVSGKVRIGARRIRITSATAILNI